MKRIKFVEIDPLEIARQLTIMDSKLFAKITPEECLSKAWPKKFNKDTPNFRAIADQSNLLTIWVAMSLVLQPDVRKRALIIKHFIAIADVSRVSMHRSDCSSDICVLL
jgi:son of sevenless-like protein